MKIGILSLAHHHAEAYVRNLLASPGVELLGIADEDRGRGERVARETGARLFPSSAALLAQRPAGAIVASENSRHRALVEAAAAAGAHILCEKPLATNVGDAEAMLRACKKAGVRLMTAFPMRYSPPLLEVKARLDSGELGQPRCVTASNQGQLPRKHREWFVDPELAGGGALSDHVVHVADTLRWYLGREVLEVYAQSNRIFHREDVKVETGGMVVLGFEGGVFASIDCSWSRPEAWPTWGGLSFELVTDRGVVRVDGFSQNLELCSDIRDGISLLPWGSDANQAMIDEFAASIREGREARTTGEDGLAAVRIVRAAYESASSGQSVRLD
ncbi:MAG: Gfo/Idh/MocA family oxidoreductase [Rectinemataceae bacterium]|jgi:predicted dehydrogenase